MLDIILIFWVVPGLLTVLWLIHDDREDGLLTLEDNPQEIIGYLLGGVAYPIVWIIIWITSDLGRIKIFGTFIAKERNLRK